MMLSAHALLWPPYMHSACVPCGMNVLDRARDARGHCGGMFLSRPYGPATARTCLRAAGIHVASHADPYAYMYNAPVMAHFSSSSAVPRLCAVK